MHIIVKIDKHFEKVIFVRKKNCKAKYFNQIIDKISELHVFSADILFYKNCLSHTHLKYETQSGKYLSSLIFIFRCCI